MKRTIVFVLTLVLVFAFASTAFAIGSSSYYGTCTNNFNTSSRISGWAHQTGWDRVNSANKSSWTSRIYSSNGQCQANPNQMSPNGIAREQVLNHNANNACYLNVKNPGGSALVIPDVYAGYKNAHWGIK